MSSDQAVFIAAAFVVLALATLFAWREWLPAGKIKFAALLFAGIGIIALLWLADIPPDWFDGSGEGFALAGGFLVMSILGRHKSETSFRLPLLLGMGGTMLALNVWAHL
jgi:hypothetical protein